MSVSLATVSVVLFSCFSCFLPFSLLVLFPVSKLVLLLLLLLKGATPSTHLFCVLRAYHQRCFQRPMSSSFALKHHWNPISLPSSLLRLFLNAVPLSETSFEFLVTPATPKTFSPNTFTLCSCDCLDRAMNPKLVALQIAVRRIVPFLARRQRSDIVYVYELERSCN